MKLLTPKIFAYAILTAFTFSSCKTTKVVVNREVESKNDGPMLLGIQTKSQLLKSHYSDWYAKEHDEYEVDQKAIAQLKKEKLNTYNLTVVMGTWCEDSHIQIPRLMKILETAGYPENKLSIIAVNRKKESPGGEEGRLNIQKVPTIIVNRYGKEVGRIVESPEGGWIERHLLKILEKDNGSALKSITAQ